MATSPVHYADAFRDAADFLIDVLEGGGQLTDNPNDAGRLTRWGISQRQYPALDIRNLTREQAIQIYYDDYWVPCYADNLPRPLALIVFCAWVNIGPRSTAMCLQRAVGTVEVDGRLGSRTLGAARRFRTELELRARLNREIIDFYTRLSTDKPFHRPNLKGWIGRVLRVADMAGQWAAE